MVERSFLHSGENGKEKSRFKSPTRKVSDKECEARVLAIKLNSLAGIFVGR